MSTRSRGAAWGGVASALALVSAGPCLSVRPHALTVPAGHDPTTFTATLGDVAVPVSWSLAGPGALSTGLGDRTDYSPPPDVPATRVARLTAAAWGETASAPIVIDPANLDPATAKSLVQDFASGTFPVATHASAADPTATLDPRGATRVSYASALPDQFTGVRADGPWDLSASDLFVLDVGFDAAQANTRIAVFFCFEEGGGFSNFAAATEIMVGIPKPGRVAIPIRRSALAVTGTARWSAVRRIEIRLVATAVATRPDAMYLYGLWSHVSARPKVVISFDDGNASVYARAFPIMAAAGMRGTLYLNGQSIGLDQQLTLSQVGEMYASGWDVANHTIDHTALAASGTIARAQDVATFTASNPADVNLVHGDPRPLRAGDAVTISGADQPEYNGAHVVTGVPSPSRFTFTVRGDPPTPATGWIAFAEASDAEIRRAILEQGSWAASHGFSRGHEHFAYPQGYFDDNSIGILRELGFRTGRTVNVEPLDYLWPTFTGIGDAFHIPAYPLGARTTLRDLVGRVDDAIARRSSLHVFGHELVDRPATTDLEFPAADFQAFIDALRARRDSGRLDVVTITEWYARL